MYRMLSVCTVTGLGVMSMYYIVVKLSGIDWELRMSRDAFEMAVNRAKIMRIMTFSVSPAFLRSLLLAAYPLTQEVRASFAASPFRRPAGFYLLLAHSVFFRTHQPPAASETPTT